MTSANTPPEGFETKTVPGYVPAAVPVGGDPIADSLAPGYTNTPGADRATTTESDREDSTAGQDAGTSGGTGRSASTRGGKSTSSGSGDKS